MKASHRLPLFLFCAASAIAGGCSSNDNHAANTSEGGAGPGDASLDANLDAGDGGAKSTGTHTTVQAAIDAAVASGRTDRIYIEVMPGKYREVVCVPSSAPPITLYSASSDAAQTVIAFNNFNGEMKPAGTAANPCTTNGSATTFGTAGSATFSAFAKGFQAKNLTISNDVTPAQLTAEAGAGTQAVALMTEADQVILENVRVLGHQDTLYTETPNSDTVVRVYVKNSYVAGDVDFIFGGATTVLDGTQVQFVSDRRNKGNALAPSTDSRNLFGVLAINSTFSADPGTPVGNFGLGRAWDHSCGANAASYLSTCVAAGHYPNGQALVRNSMLDSHIAAAAWASSATTARLFCNTDWACAVPDGGVDASGTCPANRLFEYQNTGAGVADAGGASDDGGTCTEPRPQLSDMQAATFTILAYLAQAGSLPNGLTADPWDPTPGIGDVTTFTPTYVVAAP